MQLDLSLKTTGSISGAKLFCLRWKVRCTEQGGTDTQLQPSVAKTLFSHLTIPSPFNSVASSTPWQRYGADGKTHPTSLTQPNFHRRKQYWLSATLAAADGQMYTSCLRFLLKPADSKNPSFRTGDALRMDVVEKAAVSEIAVVCGAERGVFELTKFGPGGASRCIRSVTKSFRISPKLCKVFDQ